ncbi:Hypothetical predicted protein [Octopus vulgaris]|uniref:Uncharacterized protein n=1 Tax=Octopus vulgaris TaxID=6645 RepID=A0AA36F4Z7_OCTVU|nr:Hypothetical predicted protein [Octopus vulgaris]
MLQDDDDGYGNCDGVGELLLQLCYSCKGVISILAIIVGVECNNFAADIVPVVVIVSRSQSDTIVCGDIHIVDRSSQATC